MEIRRLPQSDHDHEEVVEAQLGPDGPTAFIAVHSTKRGPAAGGLRFRPYPNREAALGDVLRLSRGMTYKNASADLPLGGGKAVIAGDPRAEKSPALFEAFAALLNALEGRYWTAEDMGVDAGDMEAIAAHAPYVAGRATGSHASGDPSPITARGVLAGMRVAVRHRLGHDRLEGLRVAIQGLGHVGMALADLAHGEGASLAVADPVDAATADAAARLGAAVITPDEILSAQADILAPCAMGAILNARSIPDLKVQVVAGAANNQLATDADAARLDARGILYAPDYVLNAGGIVNVAAEILKIDDRAAFVDEKLAAMAATMDTILTEAARLGVSPAAVADRMVEARL